MASEPGYLHDLASPAYRHVDQSAPFTRCKMPSSLNGPSLNLIVFLAVSSTVLLHSNFLFFNSHCQAQARQEGVSRKLS